MQRTAFYLLFLTAFFLYGNTSAFSADELFDTKAAAQHTEKGIEHLKGKDLDAAIKEFEASVAINPDAEAYYFLGYTYYLKGKTGDGESRKLSRENFDKAYELNPNFSPSRLMEPAAAAPKQAPAPPAAAVPGAQPEAETAQPGVFQGTAQPEQQKGPQTPPPPEAPEPPKEQPPQPPAEPPKEQQPPQQPEQRKSY
jgi:tetratricopeptide (TPR) repeat protein